MQMIGVSDALKEIDTAIKPLDTENVQLINALNQVISTSINSPIDMPPFPQSAMDGYAVNGSTDRRSFTLIGEIKAGDDPKSYILQEGEAVRIFTGAAVPTGASAVIKQEDVEVNGGQITVKNDWTSQANIRPQGEQIETGALAMEANTVVTSGVAGFLYTLGIQEVDVFCKPKVAIIATGNELTEPGKALTPGKIYESNTYMLQMALHQLGIEAQIMHVEDDYKSTYECIQNALNECDLLLTSGGISVGDYDFVEQAFLENQVTPIFYKIKQKPGKPVFFGTKEAKAVFGLPGNPAAALSSFYIYVIPAIRKMMGYKNTQLETRVFSLAEDYKKTPKIAHFLKAKYINNCVQILPAQSSAMLSSFAESNCLVHMPEGQDFWSKDAKVTAYILPK